MNSPAAYEFRSDTECLPGIGWASGADRSHRLDFGRAKRRRHIASLTRALSLGLLSQPAKRVVAEGCPGMELHRPTIFSPIYAGAPFRTDIRNRPTIRSSGCVQPRDKRLRLPQAHRATTRNRRYIGADCS